MTAARQTIREDIEGDPPTLDRATLEGLAEHAYEARQACPRGTFGRDSARGLAAGQGVEVDTDGTLAPGYDGLALLDLLLVLVRPSRDGALLSLRILHELAHLILQRLGWRHSHGDVWVLALAMAVPPSMLRAARAANCNALDLAALACIPAWAASARLDMTSVNRG